MAFSRLDAVPLQERFDFKMPVNYSSDLGETWQWGVSEFPVVSSVQKPAMLRLKEGPIVLCSFTDSGGTGRIAKVFASVPMTVITPATASSPP
jgi:hypothetical protein